MKHVRTVAVAGTVCLALTVVRPVPARTQAAPAAAPDDIRMLQRLEVVRLAR